MTAMASSSGMRWKHTLAICVAVLVVGTLAWAAVPLKTVGVQMPTMTDMGRCPTGPQASNCLDNYGETPTWHYQDGGTQALGSGGGGGSGTVTSVALTVPAIMSVAGSPVTTSGTLAVSLATQTANKVWASATSGGAATPAFRALVDADLPAEVAYLDVAQSYTASQNVAIVTLSDGATISTNAALGNSFTVTIAGNRTLANPTNLVSGGVYQWEIVQSAGGNTLAYGSDFKWPGSVAPTLQTAAGAKDLISCLWDGTDLLCGSLAGSGGGASTGNYSFSGNTMDLTGAATMSIAPTTATAITLGQTTTLAANKDLLLASGTGKADFSGGSGVFKTTTGAATLGSSSYSFNSAYTGSLGHSMVSCAANNTGAVATGATDTTTGNTIQFKQPVTVSGIRFYWVGGVGAKTVKTILYNSSNSNVGTCNASVNAAGIYSCTFTPVTVSSSNTYKTYTLSLYETTGTNYTYLTTNVPCFPIAGNGNTVYHPNDWVTSMSTDIYSSGDNRPATEAATTGLLFPIEPIFSAP